MDGVLAKSASVHAAALEKAVRRISEQRSARTGEAFVPFDPGADYRRYVDDSATQSLE